MITALVQNVFHLRLPIVKQEERYVLSDVSLRSLHQSFCTQHEMRFYDYSETGRKTVYVHNCQENGGQTYFYHGLQINLENTTFTLIPLEHNKPRFFKISYTSADSPAI